jgi:acetyl-CoA synthetase
MSERTAIESILQESRVFPPPAEFAENAHISSFAEYERLYAEAEANGTSRSLSGSWAGS